MTILDTDDNLPFDLDDDDLLPFDLPADKPPPFEATRTLEDFKVVIGDEIAEAAETLRGDEIDALCEFIRQKLDGLQPF
jgi:hypothetical protein